jgi:UDP-N-acetylenolpyruvoylglucosamine reductase, C-terminal domain
VLALTNRGNATGADIEALARAVRERVYDAFGVTLVPEPVTVGITW